MALLTFLGAIQQVTGSCYLVESRDGEERKKCEDGFHVIQTDDALTAGSELHFQFAGVSNQKDSDV